MNEQITQTYKMEKVHRRTNGGYRYHLSMLPIPLNLLLLILKANLQLVLEKVQQEGKRKEVSEEIYYAVCLMN